MEKAKVKRLLFITVVIILLLFVYQLKKGDPSSNQVNDNAKTTATKTNEIPELQFSKEELEEYYKVYKNPYVLAVRTALNSYLDGKQDGLDETLAIEKGEVSDTNALMGLDSFDKDYYKSKFIVFSINDYIGGGQLISIIFKDKPDKVFSAWVYDVGGEGNYLMRGFMEDIRFNADKMQTIQKQYKSFFADEAHML